MTWSCLALAHLFYSPVTKPPKIMFTMKTAKKTPQVTAIDRSSATDLLGTLLDDQSLLGASSKDIEITREGNFAIQANSLILISALHMIQSA